MNIPQATNGMSPWMVGQLSPGWKYTLQQGADGLLPLVGVTTNQLSLAIYSVAIVNGVNTYTRMGTGAGVFAFASDYLTSSIVIYTPVVADIPVTPGNYAVRVLVNFGGTSPYATFYIPWTVQS